MVTTPFFITPVPICSNTSIAFSRSFLPFFVNLYFPFFISNILLTPDANLENQKFGYILEA
jgi:hypothetical protein